MSSHPYVSLVRYKRWADRGLYEVIAEHFDRLNGEDATIVLRILDHIHVVDRIFQHHLQGRSHAFHAPRSDEIPDLRTLTGAATDADEWYVSYVESLSAVDLDRPVEFTFTDGTPARMTRGEIILHVCLHGTYHRGNAGILLQKSGIKPNDDRVTDFLGAAA
jgi:uncharacterized damage-inducible protein DinB